MYYYASEHAFNPKEKGLKDRLQQLGQDLLIEAKKVRPLENTARFSPCCTFRMLTLYDARPNSTSSMR
jgi:hypothetical protein